jgi:hypothetical protein
MFQGKENRGRLKVKGKWMKIEKGTEIGIVVDKAWSYLKNVRRFLGTSDDGETRFEGKQGESHLIFAPALDDTDDRGLWIEINSEKELRKSITP